jgi:excisionase family DNA binding protein
MTNEKLHKAAANFTDGEPLMPRRQVADALQVHQNTVIRLEGDGRLPALRFGPFTVRYKRTDVLQLIQNSLTTK